MPHLSPWRAQHTFTTTGTGTLTLGSAVSPDVAFSVQMADGDTGLFAAEEFDAGTGAATGAWEVFRGTLGAGGTTLTRDAVVRSSTGTSLINWAAGTKRVYALQDGGSDVQTFTVGGGTTWTKPLWANVVHVVLIGGGGGGGSGRKGAAASVRSGGGAGAGGSFVYEVFAAAALGATETVTVGAAADCGR